MRIDSEPDDDDWLCWLACALGFELYGCECED